MTLLKFIEENVPLFHDTTHSLQEKESRKLFLSTLLDAASNEPIAVEALHRELSESGELLRAIWSALAYATLVDPIPEIINPLVESLMAFIKESIEW